MSLLRGNNLPKFTDQKGPSRQADPEPSWAWSQQSPTPPTPHGSVCEEASWMPSPLSPFETSDTSEHPHNRGETASKDCPAVLWNHQNTNWCKSLSVGRFVTQPQRTGTMRLRVRDKFWVVALCTHRAERMGFPSHVCYCSKIIWHIPLLSFVK